MRSSIIIFGMCLCGVVLGYNLGVFSAIYIYIDHLFHASMQTISLISASLPLAAALSALCIGFSADRIGRRTCLLLSAILFILGALQNAVAESLFGFVLGRTMLGLAVGMCTVLVPLYLVELAPVEVRGRWVILYFISINLGVLVASILGHGLLYMGLWRFLLLLSAVPAIVMLFVCYYLPESPRWLILNGQQGQAGQALIKLFGSKKAMAIISDMDAVHHRKIYQKVQLKSWQGLKMLLVGVLINMFAQAVGVHAVASYLVIMLDRLNFSWHLMTALSSVAAALIFIVSALFAMRLIDYLSRRKMLLLGLTGTISSLLVIAWSLNSGHDPTLSALTVSFGCVFFLGCQGFSLAPMASLLPAELFPQSLRGAGMGLSIAAGWATNTVIVYSFPKMLSEYGANISFGVFLIFAAVAWGWCYFNVPETNQVALEKMETHLLSAEDSELDYEDAVSGSL